MRIMRVLSIIASSLKHALNSLMYLLAIISVVLGVGRAVAR